MVGGVWKPPKLTTFGLKSCPQGFELTAPLKHPGAAKRKPYRLESNFVSLGGFQTPPTKMSCTTPHYVPNYEILQKKEKIVNYLFNRHTLGSLNIKQGENTEFAITVFIVGAAKSCLA